MKVSFNNDFRVEFHDGRSFFDVFGEKIDGYIAGVCVKPYSAFGFVAVVKISTEAYEPYKIIFLPHEGWFDDWLTNQPDDSVEVIFKYGQNRKGEG